MTTPEVRQTESVESALRRAERAIVRALRDAGFGSQSQVTHDDRFEIVTDEITVRVEISDAA